MVSMLGLADCSDERVVDALGSAPRTSSAYRHLLGRGPAAVPAIRTGLHHPDPGVREQCCRLLDHLLIQDAVGEMIAMLDDPVPAVRTAALHALSCDRCKTAALHALSCDRCKTDASCPAQDMVLPPGLRLLGGDPDAHVRAMAIELVGRFAHSSAEAAIALVRAREADCSSAVRKKAAWYAPGGTVYRRTAATTRPRSADERAAQLGPGCSGGWGHPT